MSPLWINVTIMYSKFYVLQDQAHINSRGWSVLQRNLKRCSLRTRGVIPMDGNCLFHALVDQLRQLHAGRYRHLQLRHLVCDYLKENPSVVGCNT